MTDMPADVDAALFDAVTRLARGHSRTTVAWLTAQVRRELKDARITAETIERVVETNADVVGRPDGTVSHLLEVLDGSVFTHRVRHRLADRDDLWVNLGLQPLTSILLDGPVPLAAGGELRLSSYGHDALIGPAGWLPALEIGDLMGVRFDGGAVRVEAVAGTALPGPKADQAARKAIARHYRRERWWSGSDDLEERPAELTRAIGHAVLEDPTLFQRPQRPLDELLYDALEQHVDDHHWRDFASVRQDTSVSFSISGMPQSLDSELTARARQYGMSTDQYVIAILGFLAWRTPFAEDMAPWETWDPEHLRRRDNIRLIRADDGPS